MLVALTRRPFTLIALAVLTIYLPSYLATQFLPPAPENLFSVAYLIAFLQALPIGGVAAIFFTWIAFQLLPDEETPRSQLGYVAVRAPILILVSVIVGVVGLLGFLLLVVPGITWHIACSVVFPVAAIERRGLLKALQRSIDLTRNRLAVIFGYSLALALAWGGFALVLALALTGWNFEGLLKDPFVLIALQPITDTVSLVLVGAFNAALYVELVRLKATSPDNSASSN